MLDSFETKISELFLPLKCGVLEKNKFIRKRQNRKNQFPNLF